MCPTCSSIAVAARVSGGHAERPSGRRVLFCFLNGPSPPQEEAASARGPALRSRNKVRGFVDSTRLPRPVHAARSGSEGWFLLGARGTGSPPSGSEALPPPPSGRRAGSSDPIGAGPRRLSAGAQSPRLGSAAATLPRRGPASSLARAWAAPHVFPLRPRANQRPRSPHGPAPGPAPAQSQAGLARAPPPARPAVGAPSPGRRRPQTLGTTDPRAAPRARRRERVGRAGRAGPGAVWGPGGGRAGGRQDGLHGERRGQGGGRALQDDRQEPAGGRREGGAGGEVAAVG